MECQACGSTDAGRWRSSSPRPSVSRIRAGGEPGRQGATPDRGVQARAAAPRRRRRLHLVLRPLGPAERVRERGQGRRRSPGRASSMRRGARSSGSTRSAGPTPRPRPCWPPRRRRAVLDPDEDVVVLVLTSHGSPDGIGLVAGGETASRDAAGRRHPAASEPRALPGRHRLRLLFRHLRQGARGRAHARDHGGRARQAVLRLRDGRDLDLFWRRLLQQGPARRAAPRPRFREGQRPRHRRASGARASILPTRRSPAAARSSKGSASADGPAPPQGAPRRSSQRSSRSRLTPKSPRPIWLREYRASVERPAPRIEDLHIDRFGKAQQPRAHEIAVLRLVAVSVHQDSCRAPRRQPRRRWRAGARPGRERPAAHVRLAHGRRRSAARRGRRSAWRAAQGPEIHRAEIGRAEGPLPTPVEPLAPAAARGR